ncbi:MAG TPA: hypothetical protein VLV83_15695 [Acidobacteriota bacterium]|nr:hypothetical protein [Acidobacteriota bacterium]
MSVYKLEYKQYTGPFTPGWSRFLVLTRYAFRGVFRSRWTVALFVIAALPALVFGALIYLRYNATFLDTFGLRISDFVPIDATFFQTYLGVQVGWCWILAAIIGPGLVSPDLANGGLPLYFCRPFSRAEYVIGKGSVLFFLLSAITWIPGLILIFLQTAYGGMGWLLDNLNIPFALVVSSMLWILALTLLALALSAWVKWRMVAGALVFIIVVVLSSFGGMINLLLGTYWGSLIDMPTMNAVVMHYLFQHEQLPGTVPMPAALVSLAVLLLCSLWLLNRRVQAYEVVR